MKLSMGMEAIRIQEVKFQLYNVSVVDSLLGTLESICHGQLAGDTGKQAGGDRRKDG